LAIIREAGDKMMSFRGKLMLVTTMVWLISLDIQAPQLIALAKEENQVDLTILYTGDEYGYLEPCG